MTDVVERVELPGVRNLRDLGGHVAADDRTVVPRRLYRAEALALRNGNESNAIWDEDNAQAYASLNLAAVIDLRAEFETSHIPSAWALASDAEYVSVSLPEGAPGTETDLLRPVLAGERTGFSGQDLGDYYLMILEKRAREFGTVMETIARPRTGPVLIHCSAGKDRTGLVIALVLGVLGVDREAILYDFELTGTFRPNRVEHYREEFAKRNLDVDAVRAVFETPRIAMEKALAHIDANYGGAEGYLLKRSEIEPETITALRRALLS